MQKQKKLKYDFVHDDYFTPLIINGYVAFILLASSLPIFISFLIFSFTYWLLYSLFFSKFRVTAFAIVGIKYIKPFQKKVKYSFLDVKEVFISKDTLKHGQRIYIRLKSNKKIILQNYYDSVELIKFFMDKNIPVKTIDPSAKSYLDKLFVHNQTNNLARKERLLKRKKSR